ncbi:MAG: hypothetical protein Q7K30_00045 [Myxosarcina sp. JB018]|nr:hypothetical protein [Myxosarcina sp. JB018]
MGEKQTWLCSGFNKHQVRGKRKLGRLIDYYNGSVGSIGIILAIKVMEEELQGMIGVLMPLLVAGYLMLAMYVQRNMTE